MSSLNKSSKPKVEPHCTVMSVLLMVSICAVCYVLASWLWWEAVKTPTVPVFTSLALMKTSMMTDTGSRMNTQHTVSTHTTVIH